METELKLGVPPAAIGRLSAHPIFRKAGDEFVETLAAI
jgi:hypothetical protein